MTESYDENQGNDDPGCLTGSDEILSTIASTFDNIPALVYRMATRRDGDMSLSAYQAVVWQSGEESSADDTFDTTEQSRVTTYLNGGGKLFVSGAEIGWDLDYLNNGRLFYNNYLKADYSADDADTYNVTSVPGSMFDGIPAFAFDNGSAIYDVDYPDVLNTYGGSTAALSYSGGTGGHAAVVYDGSFQVVNFGFPFEAITDAYRRIEVMTAILDFFGNLK